MPGRPASGFVGSSPSVVPVPFSASSAVHSASSHRLAAGGARLPLAGPVYQHLLAPLPPCASLTPYHGPGAAPALSAAGHGAPASSTGHGQVSLLARPAALSLSVHVHPGRGVSSQPLGSGASGAGASPRGAAGGSSVAGATTQNPLQGAPVTDSHAPGTSTAGGEGIASATPRPGSGPSAGLRHDSPMPRPLAPSTAINPGPSTTTSIGGGHGAANSSIFDPFRPGRLVRAVFARIHIPHFDHICGVLGERAARYSNTIAKIVHDTALAWGGSPVANSGHGFLCVWSIDDAWEELAVADPLVAQFRDRGGEAPGFLGRPTPLAQFGPIGAGSGLPAEGRASSSVATSFALPTGRSAAGDEPAAASSARGASFKSMDAGGEPGHPAASASAMGSVVSLGLGLGLAQTLVTDSDGAAAATASASRATTGDHGHPHPSPRSNPRSRSSVAGGGGPGSGGGGSFFRGPATAPASRRNSTSTPPSAGTGAVGEGLGLGGRQPASRRGSLGAIITGMSDEERAAAAAAGTGTGGAGGAAAAGDGGVGRPSRSGSQYVQPQHAGGRPAAFHHTADDAGLSAAAPAATPATAAGSFADLRGPWNAHDTRAQKMLVEAASEIADKALIACIKAIAAMWRSVDVHDSEEFHALRDSETLRGYRAELHCGLHAGWTIEGVVGSAHKVDACYLGHAVDLTASLQQLAPTYGAPIVASGAFFRLLSPAARALCRKVDSVYIHTDGKSLESGGTALAPPHSARDKLAAAPHPCSIYAVDMFDWGATLPPGLCTGQAGCLIETASPLVSFSHFALHGLLETDTFNKTRKRMPDHDRCISIVGAADIIEHPINPRKYHRGIFADDVDLRIVAAAVPQQCRAIHGRAMQAFVCGRWDVAKSLLHEVAREIGGGGATSGGGDDGSSSGSGSGAAAVERISEPVYQFMRSHGFVPPISWDGRRYV